MKMRLYHVGDRAIPEPDVHYGRRNADFGQGFYLTPEPEFARRWAGEKAVLNEYELELDGLTVQYLQRDEAWFDCIFRSRRGQDSLCADVVIGPIANDTIFDTMGIVSSGFLAPSEALWLLQIGPAYTQVAVRTPAAAGQLRWLGAEALSRPDEETRRREAADYQRAFAAALTELAGEE